jgi:hypothetical protein
LRRDQAAAGAGLPAFKRLMRYNDWKHDPLSGGAPFAAVCGRGDLAPEGADFGPVLKGCYDSKVRWGVCDLVWGAVVKFWLAFD